MTVRSAAEPSPPTFLRLVGHPLRWSLLRHLAESDRQVRELTQLVDQPQNLVSYHLGLLRGSRLVSMRRSSFDGRDAYYSVDLARCKEMLGAVGEALHPALRSFPPQQAASRRGGSHRLVRVLFMCTGNSARSQIAEALMRAVGGDVVDVHSAGSDPKGVHVNVVRVLSERGIDWSRLRSKHWSEVTRRRFDYVITLCDRMREACPEFRGEPRPIHWSIADPAVEGATDEETFPAFVRTACEIERRIRFLLDTIEHAREVRQPAAAGSG
jgi:protein-tyrosine-phosphatase/DNA-binding transcriptional ArsR family regulator